MANDTTRVIDSNSITPPIWAGRAVVCVAASRSVYDIISCNGKHSHTPISLMNEFTSIQQYDTSFKSATGCVNLHNMNVAYVSLNNMRTRDPLSNSDDDQLKNQLSRKLMQLAKSSQVSKNASKISDIKLVESEQDPQSSLISYMQELKELTMFNGAAHGEFLNQPTVMLVMVSTRESDIQAEIFSLTQANALPQILKENHFEIKNIEKRYVVVHVQSVRDLQQDVERCDEYFEQVKASIPDCVLLTLNSLSEYNNEVNQYQRQLSSVDRLGVRKLALQIYTSCVLPIMSSRIAELHDEIVTSRKGLRNMMGALFKSKLRLSNDHNEQSESLDSCNIVNNQTKPVFALDSIESKLRQLGDLAFVMQDYALALDIYKIVQRDYEGNDGANWLLASVQRQIGLCLSQCSAEPSMIESRFEKAVSLFVQAGELSEATLCAIYAGAALAHNNTGSARIVARLQTRVAAKASHERSALLLESAAFTNLLASPPLTRQYAFLLLRAGHMFQKFSQRIHAVRCFTNALNVYTGRGWRHIEDHLNFKLGRETYNLAHYKTAVNHFVNLLRTGTQTTSKQHTFVKEFIVVVKKWLQHQVAIGCDPAQHIVNLSVPFIDISTVRISVNRGNTLPYRIQQHIWNTALECHGNTENERVVDIGSTWKLTNEPEMLVVNEPLSLHVRFHNPLAVEVRASHIHLICDVITQQDDIDKSNFIRVENINCVLKPNQSLLVCLKLLPLAAPCQVKIRGISWRALDTVDGVIMFDNALRRIYCERYRDSIINDDTEYTMNEVIRPLPSRRLVKQIEDTLQINMPIYSQQFDYTVIAEQPLLVANVQHAPHNMLHGEIYICELSLWNASAHAMQSLTVHISDTTFIVLVDEDGGLITSSSSSSSSCASRSACFALNAMCAHEKRIQRFGLRGAQTGDHTLDILIHYTPHENSALSSRVCHIDLNIRVDSLLELNAITRYSFLNSDQRVLEVSATNSHNEYDIRVQRIMLCNSSIWQIVPLASRSEAYLQGSICAAGNKHTLLARLTRDTSFHDAESVEQQQSKLKCSYIQFSDTLNVFPDTFNQCSLYYAHIEQQLQQQHYKNTDIDNELRDFLNVCIYWKCSSSSRYGCSMLHDVNVVPTSNSPLRVNVDFNNDISHDFVAYPLLYVDVNVTVLNCSCDNVTFSMEMLAPGQIYNEESQTFCTMSSVSSVSSAWWIGATTRNQQHLAPAESLVFSLQICVSGIGGGAFNLNTMRFVVNQSSAETRASSSKETPSTRVYFFPVHRILTVHDTLKSEKNQL